MTAEQMKEFNTCPSCRVGELISVVLPEEVFSQKSVAVKCNNINCGFQGAILVSNTSMYLISVLRHIKRT
jgi:hypothetical protein